MFGAVKRELRRRSAIEPIIGHMKSDGHLGRCRLKSREGDAINVILTPSDLRCVLAWLRNLLTSILVASGGKSSSIRPSNRLLNGRLSYLAP